MRPFILISILAIAMLPSGLFAADGLQQALDTYRQAQSAKNTEKRSLFKKAQQQFQNVIDTQTDSKSAELYLALGNSALQAADMGSAIWAYRKALASESGHLQAAQNLKAARKSLPGWVPVPDTSDIDQMIGLSSIPRPFINLASGLLFLIACLGISVSIRFKWPVIRHVAVILLIIWAVLIGLRLAQNETSSEGAVVISPEGILRSADAFGATPKLAKPLPAGTEVDILETRENWVLIRLQDGRDGWLKKTEVRKVTEDA